MEVKYVTTPLRIKKNLELEWYYTPDNYNPVELLVRFTSNPKKLPEWFEGESEGDCLEQLLAHLGYRNLSWDDYEELGEELRKLEGYRYMETKDPNELHLEWYYAKPDAEGDQEITVTAFLGGKLLIRTSHYTEGACYWDVFEALGYHIEEYAFDDKGEAIDKSY